MLNKQGGKRGIQNSKGYTLKCTNNNVDNIYVYVWGSFDHEESKRVRREGEQKKNYSKSNGWRSLGRWDDSTTQDKLKAHIVQKYGDYPENIEQIELYLNEQNKSIIERIQMKQQELLKEYEHYLYYYEQKQLLDELPTYTVENFNAIETFIKQLQKKELKLFKKHDKSLSLNSNVLERFEDLSNYRIQYGDVL